MGNQLFQQARKAVENAEISVKSASTPEQIALATEDIKKAKNNLSSAFAQSTTAEKIQLAEFQNQIDNLENNLSEEYR